MLSVRDNSESNFLFYSPKSPSKSANDVCLIKVKPCLSKFTSREFQYHSVSVCLLFRP